MKVLGKVAIVGAPSTGKSTLFNRFIKQRKSIVSEEHGITRDRLYSTCEWLDKQFVLIDTGGIEVADVPFQKEIQIQVDLAIDEADVILFLVDGKAGLTNDDQYIAKQLYRVKDKPIIMAVNKIDNVDMKDNAYDFYSLGFGEPYLVSGVHGIGIGDLLDAICSALPSKEEEQEEGQIRFALIGRPNVGKSSLTNAILGEKRVIVSSIAGTTRDSIDTPLKRNGKSYVIIDTAGLKRKGKIYESIDKYAALRAMDAVSRCDIVLLVIDAEMGLIDQDRHVVQLATENNKPVIIIVNKWDLHTHAQDDQKKFTEMLRSYFVFLEYAPIIYSSALYKPNLDQIFDAIDNCYRDFNVRVQTSILNEIILEAQVRNEAPSFNGGRVKINYASQVATCPPTFVLFCNNPSYMHFSYKRYLENCIRTTFKLNSTPIKIICRKKGSGIDKII
ncbi:MAG: ribosome biogenesis GTPase Der [Bacilli bacterium]|jgi:GTP-binding protein|nr:ribosome biogenesis GTPase Der [Bacilli bacterium]